jgi:hypothetical protein
MLLLLLRLVDLHYRYEFAKEEYISMHHQTTNEYKLCTLISEYCYLAIRKNIIIHMDGWMDGTNDLLDDEIVVEETMVVVIKLFVRSLTTQNST